MSPQVKNEYISQCWKHIFHVETVFQSIYSVLYLHLYQCPCKLSLILLVLMDFYVKVKFEFGCHKYAVSIKMMETDSCCLSSLRHCAAFEGLSGSLSVCFNVKASQTRCSGMSHSRWWNNTMAPLLKTLGLLILSMSQTFTGRVITTPNFSYCSPLHPWAVKRTQLR